MKFLFSTLITCLSLNAQSEILTYEDEFEQKVQNCSTSAQSLEEKRKCITECLEIANNNIEAKTCLAASVEIEKNEYEKVYQNAVSSAKNLINEGDEYSKEEGTETLSRYEAYNSILENYLDARCRVEALDMLGGSRESITYMSCMSEVYKSSINVITREEY